MDRPILEVRDLVKRFPVAGGFAGFFGRKNEVHAVDGVSFDIHKSEAFGLVGESGCGKSTTGKLIVRLLEPTSGSIFFDDQDISQLSGRVLKEMRRNLQIIFQNPYSSLDPRWSIERSLSEPLITHNIVSKRQVKERIAELLRTVGLDPDYMYRYPHQFSGGQTQRIGLARALAVNPALLVADEPVSALDVSVQAQILNLMQDLQEASELSILFISHDLSVVRYLSDRVGVMYLGKLVEMAPVEELFANPAHPYTQVLLSAIPVPSIRRKRQPIILEGEVPSPIHPPSHCRFRTRCPHVMDICAEIDPPVVNMGNDHVVACHLVFGRPDPDGDQPKLTQ
jgi:oligopeptide/dipeptide ABC transporter ATP-binding protein